MQRALSPSAEFFITSFGLGRLRPAPGTWGSLPPVALAAALIAINFGPCETCAMGGTFGPKWWIYNGVLLAVVIIFSLVCILVGDRAEAHFGKKDPGSVTADETAGMSIALLALPHASMQQPLHAAAWLIGAFLAFRLFDILKLWPAYRLQRIPGGWGILIDDIVAGIQALIVLQVIGTISA